MATSKTKEVLLSFEQELLIDELHNLLTKQQIDQLITNLQKKQISGKELNDKIDEFMEQLNIPQTARNGVLKLPESQKRKLLQQYTKQLENKAPPPTSPRAERKETEIRKNTYIMPDKNEIIFQGWLLKKGKYHKDYKKRWFVLFHNNILAYYEKPEHAKNGNKAALGEISLYNVTKIVEKAREDKNVGKKYKFELVSKDRTFVLKSEDPQPYEKWLNKINVRINPNKVFQGWAQKRGGSKGHWTKRYFVLVNYEKVFSELRYYQDTKLTKFKGMIDVSEVSKVQPIDGQESIKKYGKGHGQCLELVTPSRTYVMSFKDISLRNQWKEEIIHRKFDDDGAIDVDNRLFRPTISQKKVVKKDQDDVKEVTEVTLGIGDKLGVNPLHTGIESNVNNNVEKVDEENNNNKQNEVEIEEENEENVDNQNDEDSDSFA
eukprot:221865_1